MITNLLKTYQLTSYNKSLSEKISELEQRIFILEQENVETTNVLYEIMQDIRAVDSRIDILFANYEKRFT